MRTKTKKNRIWSLARGKVAREGRCRVCRGVPGRGGVIKLDAAHTVGRKHQDVMVVRVGEGVVRAPAPGEKAEEILVREDSVVPLCLSRGGGCHQLYDAGRLDLLPYLTVEEQADAVRAVGLERAYSRLTGSRRDKHGGDA